MSIGNKQYHFLANFVIVNMYSFLFKISRNNQEDGPITISKENVVKKENPNPLDLSVTKKEDDDDDDEEEDISIEIKNEVKNKSVEIKNEVVKHEIAAKLEETNSTINKNHHHQTLDEDLDEELDEDYDEMEDQDELMAAAENHPHPEDEEEEEEPRGFKPLHEGKSFIPIKDQVTFKPYSDVSPSSNTTIPSSTTTPKTPTALNGDPSSLTVAAMTNSVPPTYPRPINPLILEAMYRMQTQRQSPFGGFYGGSATAAGGAPRPPYPFPPSLMAAAGLNGSPFGHSRYPGSDLFHPLHHHASHGGHPICNKPKDR